MEIILIIFAVISGLSAIWYFGEKINTLSESIKQKKKLVTKTDPRARIFFNDGWDGFDDSTEEYVIHVANINPPLDYVDHIEILREFKPEVFSSRVEGLLAAPEMTLNPYRDEAVLNLVVVSTENGQQSEQDYHEYFENYAPIFPDTVFVDACDGNSEAMWCWSTRVPIEWLQDTKPYIRPEYWVEIEDILESWVNMHNKEIARIYKQIEKRITLTVAGSNIA